MKMSKEQVCPVCDTTATRWYKVGIECRHCFEDRTGPYEKERFEYPREIDD